MLINIWIGIQTCGTLVSYRGNSHTNCFHLDLALQLVRSLPGSAEKKSLTPTRKARTPRRRRALLLAARLRMAPSTWTRPGDTWRWFSSSGQTSWWDDKRLECSTHIRLAFIDLVTSAYLVPVYLWRDMFATCYSTGSYRSERSSPMQRIHCEESMQYIFYWMELTLGNRSGITHGSVG